MPQATSPAEHRPGE